MRPGLAAGLFLLLTAAVSGCGGGNGGDGEGPSGTTPPPAQRPTLQANETSLGEGSLDVLVPPGQTLRWDVAAIALQAGVMLQSCDGFALLFGWQVRDPYPPGRAGLTFSSELRGSRAKLGGGAKGTARAGCGNLLIENPGDGPVRVEFRFIAVQVRP